VNETWTVSLHPTRPTHSLPTSISRKNLLIYLRVLYRYYIGMWSKKISHSYLWILSLKILTFESDTRFLIPVRYTGTYAKVKTFYPVLQIRYPRSDIGIRDEFVWILARKSGMKNVRILIWIRDKTYRTRIATLILA
jgi:hypothetical protein